MYLNIIFYISQALWEKDLSSLKELGKLEVDVYLLVNLPNSANKAAANIHSTKISVSAIKSAEKIHPITSDKTGMIIANIR